MQDVEIIGVHVQNISRRKNLREIKPFAEQRRRAVRSQAHIIFKKFVGKSNVQQIDKSRLVFFDNSVDCVAEGLQIISLVSFSERLLDRQGKDNRFRDVIHAELAIIFDKFHINRAERFKPDKYKLNRRRLRLSENIFGNGKTLLQSLIVIGADYPPRLSLLHNFKRASHPAWTRCPSQKNLRRAFQSE